MRMFGVALAVAGSVLLASSGNAQEQLIKYCKPDIERLCAAVPPGEGRLLKCLKAHGEQISVGCAKALKELKG